MYLSSDITYYQKTASLVLQMQTLTFKIWKSYFLSSGLFTQFCLHQTTHQSFVYSIKVQNKISMDNFLKTDLFCIVTKIVK